MLQALVSFDPFVSAGTDVPKNDGTGRYVLTLPLFVRCGANPWATRWQRGSRIPAPRKCSETASFQDYPANL